MREDWPLALGMLWYSMTEYVRERYGAATRWILTRRWICAAWERVYREWLDDGDRVLRVISFRTALIESRHRSRRCSTAIFWPFKSL